MNECKEFFLNEKPVDALVMLEKSSSESYSAEVSEAIDSTYAHTVKIISEFEDFGLIETEKSGRKKMLKLTSTGKELAELFESLLESFEAGHEVSVGGQLGDKDILEKSQR